MLVLNESQMWQAITLDEVLEAVEDAFAIHKSGHFLMPDRSVAEQNGDKLMFMPCFLDSIIGTKMLAEFPNNPEKGLPYLSGLVILNNRETGQPEAILNGGALTAMRTGAVGAVGIKYLAPENAGRVGLVGCGVQGFHQLLYACHVRKIREIRLYDAYKKDLSDFIEKLRARISSDDIEYIICHDTRELAENSDILISCTQTVDPVYPDDMELLREQMRQEYPDLPYLFFGHSMGSFLTRTYLIRHPEKYDAAILSGTGHQAKALVTAGSAAAELMVKMKGPRADGTFLNNMAFGSYCKKIPNPRTPFDWLSRDPEQVDKYIADPLCGFVAKVSLYRDMMNGIKFITDQKNIDRMDKEHPIYFMSGEDDPVGDYGEGVKRAYRAFLRAGLHDVTMRLYPGGRHEMLNELNKEDVYQDILRWLNSIVDKL